MSTSPRTTGEDGRGEARRSRIRVIVVDDEHTMRAALRELVSHHPAFELVGACASGDEAVELARAQRPDVVLLDVRMPAGGPSAARRIAESSPNTAVVALSALGDYGTINSMMAAGAVDYLVKGRASMTDIISAIEQAAERS
jgi:two-component system response regulator DevR